MSDPIENAKNGVALIGELMKAAGENPQVREAGSHLGTTAITLTKAINNVLLPVAAVNFAFDKAKNYFNNRFPKEFSEKASAIPVDQIVEPKASIAGPVLQGLAFTHDEDDLREMYLNLLTTSMDARVVNDAHPAFVEIIKQISAEEIHILKDILAITGPLPIVEIRRNTPGAYWILERHLLDLRDNDVQTTNPRLEAMVDNWIRLGLVQVDYTVVMAGNNDYGWVTSRSEYKSAKDLYPRDYVYFQSGAISRTALGAQFGRAVGINHATTISSSLSNVNSS